MKQTWKNQEQVLFVLNYISSIENYARQNESNAFKDVRTLSISKRKNAMI